MANDKYNDISIDSSINVYIIWLSIFFLIMLFNSNKGEGSSFDDLTPDGSLLFKLIFFIIILAFQIHFNLNLYKSFCGNNDEYYITALFYTILPNLLILGLTIVLLNAFPPWKSFFSNTFGYFLTAVVGIGGNTNKLLTKLAGRENDVANANNNDSKLNVESDLIQSICKDQSLILNEITPENFKSFMNKLDSINFIKNKNYKNNDIVVKLYNSILVKDMIAEYIWMLLSGLLTISVGYNSVYYLKKNCISGDTDDVSQRINKLWQQDK